jgi:cobyrinic acid a,c-diamide synthase
MGLFDGKGGGELASTAHVAKLLDAPVVLVVDARAMARSAAAMVHGYATFDLDLNVAGVVLNRVGSATHEKMLREALEPLGTPSSAYSAAAPPYGPPNGTFGLVPAVERRKEARRTSTPSALWSPAPSILTVSCASPARPGPLDAEPLEPRGA